MGMNIKERRIWLSQISRIQSEQRKAHDHDVEKQTDYFIKMKSQETAEEGRGGE